MRARIGRAIAFRHLFYRLSRSSVRSRSAAPAEGQAMIVRRLTARPQGAKLDDDRDRVDHRYHRRVHRQSGRQLESGAAGAAVRPSGCSTSSSPSSTASLPSSIREKLLSGSLAIMRTRRSPAGEAIARSATRIRHRRVPGEPDLRHRHQHQNWGLTFGGTDFATLMTSELRQDLATVLTSDYDVVEFSARRDSVSRACPAESSRATFRTGFGHCGDRRSPATPTS